MSGECSQDLHHYSVLQVSAGLGGVETPSARTVAVMTISIVNIPSPRLGIAPDLNRSSGKDRLAVERGEALPLVDVLERTGSDLRGEIVGMSFERKRGRWMYEFKVVRLDGTLAEIYVDAASAEILRQGGTTDAHSAGGGRSPHRPKDRSRAGRSGLCG